MKQDKTQAEGRSTDKFAGADGDCRTSPLWKGLADFTTTKEKTDNPEGEKGQYRGVSDKSRMMFSCEICQ